MMKIAIIEDELLAADRLEEMIMEIIPDSKIVARCTSVRESVGWLMNNTADLIFLDIQLSDGLSFSIFDRISVSTPVIFTTAYDQYAIKAFELNSISYLLKPIRKRDLEESLKKYQSMKLAFSIDFESLIASIRGEDPGYKKRFLIRAGEKLKKLETADIAYFFALEKSVFCRTFESKKMPVDYTLDALESLLDPAMFFRINRKYIVNLEAIENMLVWSRSRIKLKLAPPVKDEDDTIVSIERAADFKKWMNS